MNTNIIKHEGEINLVGVKLPCYVLEDGTRILSVPETQEVLKKIGAGYSKQKPTEWYNQYLEKRSQILLVYKKKNPTPITGFEATMLEDLFNVYLEAVKSNVKLSPKQKQIVKQHEMLLRSFAKVGIIALVDEATGYQQARESPELQKVLKAYIFSVKAADLISKNKDDFIRYLREKDYPQSDLTDDRKPVKKSDFDEMLKVLLKTPPWKKKR